MWAKKYVLIVMITLCLPLQWATPLWAQASTPTLHTACTSSLSCQIYVPPSAALTQPTLIADGEPIADTLYTVEDEAVGAAVAFVFHEYTNAGGGSPSVRSAGATGEPRYIEFRNALINFIDYAESEAWDGETYWLAAYKSGESRNGRAVSEFSTIAEWEVGLFRNEVYNKLNNYTTSTTKNTPIVPLYDLIDNAITQFSAIDESASQAEKTIVVFTNGLLDGSTQNRNGALANNTIELDSLLAHAAENGVTIHVVLLVTGSGALGANLATTLRNNAAEIATPTGGQVLWLGDTPATAGDTALVPIWEQFGKSRFQTVITADLLELAERGTVPTTLQVRSATSESSVVRPQLPQFQPPRFDEASLTPATWTGNEAIDLRIEPAWPDGYGNPARIGPVQYVIRNDVDAVVIEEIDRTAPLTMHTIPADSLSTLTDGTYTIQARFIDKLLPTVAVTTTVGALTIALPVPTPIVTATLDVSKTEEITTAPPPSEAVVTTATNGSGTAGAVALQGPSEPNPTDLITMLQQAVLPITQGVQSPMGLLAAVAVGIVLLVVAIGSWRRQRDGRRQFDTIRTSDPPDEHTLPDDQTEPDIEGFPVARLVYEAGDGNLLPEIPLYPSNGSSTKWTIGRSYQERDCYINHPRVSRSHAVLLEEDGRFYIRHEGSSGGTYVNRVPLEALVKHRVQDGDLLHFSTAVAYRFQLEEAHPQGEQTEPDTSGSTSVATEPEPTKGLDYA